MTGVKSILERAGEDKVKEVAGSRVLIFPLDGEGMPLEDCEQRRDTI